MRATASADRKKKGFWIDTFVSHITRHTDSDEICYPVEHGEYYLASEARSFLGSAKWSAFATVLQRAARVGLDVEAHFVHCRRLLALTRSPSDARPVHGPTPTPSGRKSALYRQERVIAAQDQQKAQRKAELNEGGKYGDPTHA